MKYLIITISFIISVKINAMNLLDYEAESDRVTLKDWKFFSDQVMGGVSEGNTSIEKDQGNFFLRLEGTVSTKNNGGFIQVRREYNLKRNDFKGIRFRARGKENDYYVHIRTKYLFLPWQYYAGKFRVTDSWSDITINFSDFSKSNFYQPENFSSSDIKSVAFVAFGEDFQAQLDISEAELF